MTKIMVGKYTQTRGLYLILQGSLSGVHRQSIKTSSMQTDSCDCQHIRIRSRTRDSSFGVVTGYWTSDRDFIPGRGKIFFSLSLFSDTPDFYSAWYSGRGVKLTTSERSATVKDTLTDL